MFAVGIDLQSGKKYACKVLQKEDIRLDRDLISKVKKEFVIMS